MFYFLFFCQQSPFEVVKVLQSQYHFQYESKSSWYLGVKSKKFPVPAVPIAQ